MAKPLVKVMMNPIFGSGFASLNVDVMVKIVGRSEPQLKSAKP